MKKTLGAMLCIFLFAAIGFARADETAYTYGAWLPYWEYDASMGEVEALSGSLDRAVAFACLFDSEDQPLMLTDTQTLLTALTQTCAGTDASVFLSIVNDVELSPGEYDNKSAALLGRLFADDEAINLHLEALVALIDQYCLGGLELDYENLKSDTQLWAGYVKLIARAWAICDRDGVRLRVVLPWDAPKYADLPVGPEYSVMCYNLYGYHSGPGPKADFAFLKTTCELYAALPVKARMAFATGGFDWHGDQIDALTQTQAVTLLSDAQVTPTRDANSAALKATFTADGEQHEVWYTDAQTLAAWRDVCAAYGFTGFDLFRLGDNDLEDWQSVLLKAKP